MRKGYYAIYEENNYTPNKLLASFQDIDNVRIYIEANSDLDKIVCLQIRGEFGLYQNVSGYTPITAENADGYIIKTKGCGGFRVSYILFDD